jgi:hypothetical protein
MPAQTQNLAVGIGDAENGCLKSPFRKAGRWKKNQILDARTLAGVSEGFPSMGPYGGAFSPAPWCQRLAKRSPEARRSFSIGSVFQ